MWAKFQIKIQKYGFIDKLALTGESSLKIQYLGPAMPVAAFIYSIVSVENLVSILLRGWNH
jgi:hypothetical protein